MERRVLLAISLSFLVLIAFQNLLPAPPPRPPANVSSLGGEDPRPAPPGAGVVPAPAGNVSPAVAAAVPVSTLVGESSEREIVVETQTVRASFSNRGARLRSWVLRTYFDAKGEPLNLVPGADAFGPDAPTPFSLRADTPELSARLNQSLYRTSAAGKVDATGQAETRISFELEGADGLRVSKTFTFTPTGFVVAFASDVRMGDQVLNPAVEWGPGLGNDIARAAPASFFSPNYSTPAQAVVHRDGDVVRLSQAPGADEGPFEYAGIDDHYFAALVLNGIGQAKPAGATAATSRPAMRLEHAPVVVPNPVLPGEQARYETFSVRFAAPPPVVHVFFGPKAFDELRAVDVSLVRVINFGIFRVLAVPLLGALKWIHQYIGNWGWAIVLLTVLINLAMFPLRHKSVVSMRKMQDLQPQMKAIQDRYAKYKITDPERQKMNEEVMNLYKSKGVNPASGCLPMLLMFPFLFAFFGMLSQAIEIRGAEFLGWVPDLSRPDPLYIWPILMGVTMFWQQKMTPTAMDPMQQRVMMLMPAMFTFMMLVSPAGLVIYWFIGNLWAIGQQYLTNYLIGPPKVLKKA
jgi:YidC/Oxa1 family membrane protein insertase